MYAAAGGASLASRQARQRQRQQKKTQQLQAKLHPPKASVLSVADHGASTPTRQSRQFHQLPTNYLRTPQSQVRKLSASYTAQSKLLLPIDEGDTQSVMHMRMHGSQFGGHGSGYHTHSHTHSHHHQQQQQHQPQHYHHYAGGHHGRVSPKLVHRHSGSSGTSFHHSHLPKSATATLPLVSQMVGSPEEHKEPIIDPEQDALAEKQPLTTSMDDANEDDEPMQPPTMPLERKCSVYRMRRNDAFDHLKELQFNQQQYEPLPIDEPQPQLVFKGLANGRKWQPCAYCEEGICVCEHIECAQGRAAWLERGRRCSIQEAQQQQTTCHRRWVKRNRIQDASLGGSSDDEDFLGVLRGPSTFANAFLYVGLGTVALGLVIAFVGTGEKGFKTVELRLIGPSLIVLGLICCLLRILFCICPSNCISSSKKSRKKNGNKVDADHTTSLLRGETKRVSIARHPGIQPKYPLTHKRKNSKMLNEGMEALRQLATTSLFMQNEQKPAMNRVVPIIKEPDSALEVPLEMKNIETALNTCEISITDVRDNQGAEANLNSKDSNSKEVGISATTAKTPLASKITVTTIKDERSPPLGATAKLRKQRVPLNQISEPSQSQSLSSSSTVKDSLEGDAQAETSLTILNSGNVGREACPPTLISAELSNNNAAYKNLPTSFAIGTDILPPPPPPPIYSADFRRISINQSTTSYDLPSSIPHSYTAGSYRSTGSEHHLIRGPLGMPLSALTASSSSNYPLATTAPPVNIATTTTVSLLPLPAPISLPSKMTPASTPNQYNIPGQVMESPSSNPSQPPVEHLSSISGTLSTSTLTSILATNPTPVSTHQQSVLAMGGSSMGIGGSVQGSSSLAPNTSTSSTSNIEPELVLSPAKLGQ